jgi:hypothetical protein
MEVAIQKWPSNVEPIVFGSILARCVGTLTVFGKPYLIPIQFP